MKPVVCPCCGESFMPGAARFIATSAALRGDPVLGGDAAIRFHPVRFDADGRAIDPLGGRSSQPACPSCRTALPRVLLITGSAADLWLVGTAAPALAGELSSATDSSDVSPDPPTEHPVTGVPLARPRLVELDTGDQGPGLVHVHLDEPPAGAVIATRDPSLATQATHLLVPDTAVPRTGSFHTLADDADGHHALLRCAIESAQ